MPQAKYKVNNWRRVKALVNRGSVTFWLDKKVLATRHECEPQWPEWL
ncbi:hypothetical protein [Shewanella algae]|nr:hypothetical protein [Shewanella algae]QTE87896.1 hypothetical protein JKK44_07100 [Shewanella algae]